MKSTRFLYLAWMIKYTSKTMDVMDHLVIRVNFKKTVILITNQKSFFVKQIVLILKNRFFVKQIKFEKRKALKQKISD